MPPYRELTRCQQLKSRSFRYLSCLTEIELKKVLNLYCISEGKKKYLGRASLAKFYALGVGKVGRKGSYIDRNSLRN